MRINDVFSFISFDAPEFNNLKKTLAFILKNRTFVIRPGLKNVFDNFIEVLREKQINDNITCQNNHLTQDREIIHLVQRYPLLRSLTRFPQEFEQIRRIF